MEMPLLMLVLSDAALVVFGFVFTYQPGWQRRRAIEALRKQGESARADTLEAKPLWRVRLIGAGMLLISFLAFEFTLWVADELRGDRFGIASATLMYAWGALLMCAGLVGMILGRPTQEIIARSDLPTLPSFKGRLSGFVIFMWGAGTVAILALSHPT